MKTQAQSQKRARLFHASPLVQPLIRPCHYSKPLIASGAHSEVRVGNRVVLKRPLPETNCWHQGISGDLKEYAALKAAGIHVPKLKGQILRNSPQWLIFEKARSATEQDLERRAGELASIMSALLNAKINIELDRNNIGICTDKNGRERLVVLDFVQSLFFDPAQSLREWTNPKQWKFKNPARRTAFTQRLQKELANRGITLPHSRKTL